MCETSTSTTHKNNKSQKTYTASAPCENARSNGYGSDLDLLERWRKVSKNDPAAHGCTKRIEERRAKFDRKKS